MLYQTETLDLFAKGGTIDAHRRASMHKKTASRGQIGIRKNGLSQVFKPFFAVAGAEGLEPSDTWVCAEIILVVVRASANP